MDEKRAKMGEASNPSDAQEVDLMKVSSFEDLLDVVGSRGRWTVLLFFLCCYNTLLSPLQSLSYQFMGATPDHWCKVEPFLEANWTQEQILNVAIPVSNDTNKPESCRMYNYNYSELAILGYEASLNSPLTAEKDTISCSSRTFNLSEYTSTVSIDWDLVCERRALYATTQAAVQVGNLVGCIITGYALDRFGRRPVVLLTSLVMGVISFVLSASPSIEIYIILKALNSCVGFGVYLGLFVLVMETCSSKDRTPLGTLVVVPWALGYMILPGIAYLVRPWRLLQITISLPAVGFLAYYWLLPESPRWLILNGRYNEALNELTKAAKMNGRTLPPDQEVLDAMKRIANTDEEAQNESTKENLPLLRSRATNLLKQFFILIVTPGMRLMVLSVFFGWIAAAMVYYGVALNATNLSADIYVYNFLGGLTEVPSYLLLWLALIYVGRRTTLATLYLVCGICILVVMFLMIFIPEVPVAATMTFSLIGKMAITAAFHLIWMFTAELFPTAFRSLAVGQASFFGKIGAIASPYINDVLGESVVWAPSATFGVVSLVAAGLSLLLPETMNQELSDSKPINAGKNKNSSNGQFNMAYTAESEKQEEGVVIS